MGKAALGLKYLTLASVLLAFTVILLGAYTRLTDAGLGCPDWPGCYGQLTAPSQQEAIAKANAAFPTMPVEVDKAKTEMTHRYFAETLGAFIFIFALLGYWHRHSLHLPRWLGPLLAILVVAQGLLGMWTVTLRLFPLVVMAHLLGGFCTLGLLWLAGLYLWIKVKPTFSYSPPLLYLSLSTLLIVFFQIALGGWTSANYAALICPDFPTCQGKWWPNTDFFVAFNLTGGLGLDNPLAFMDARARTTIHVMHRLGALFTFILGVILAYSLWRTALTSSNLTQARSLQYFSLAILFLLVFQLSLGISNVIFSLPLTIAVLHNGIAALLFLALISLNFMLIQGRRRLSG